MSVDLQALANPASYPHPVARVEIVQTHISIVCLAGDHVYKLKKPVRLPFLDFSTPELRERYCREELRLNRRLCPWVYLDVVPLRLGPSGLNFRGDGEVVDHAVHMRRLPAERMLDRLLTEGAVTDIDIDRLARTVAAFHRDADRGPRVRAAGDPHRLAEQMRANFTDAAPWAGTMFDDRLFARLRAVADADLARLLPALERRAAAGHVVDGHGDLHARNVCLTEPPAIYDCIEFSDAFRCGDTATEVAFMAMDLRYRGHRALAERFVTAYADAAGDGELPALLPPLVRYRALVRAKVAAMAASDTDLSEDDRRGATGSARRHLRLAAATAVEDGGACWIAACGPPASGKSFLLAALARETGWPLLQSDLIRKALVGAAPTTRLGEAAYDDATTDRTYTALCARAAASGSPVLLDATWPVRRRRAALVEAAARAGARLLLVHVTVPPEVARARLRTRVLDPTAVSDADERVFERLAPRFEPPTDDEGPVLHVTGTDDPSGVLDRILLAAIA